MTEEKIFEEKREDPHSQFKEKREDPQSHKEKDEKYNFAISKVRIWQGLSVILAIAVVFLWFNQGSDNIVQGAVVAQPTAQPAPNPTPTQPSPTQPQKLTIDEDDDPFIGDKNAPVTIVSFEDYQCPFCSRAFKQTFPLLKSEYIDTGKVKFVYRDFPLDSIHPFATPAAEAAECVRDAAGGSNEVYFEYHDKIFAGQGSLNEASFKQWAQELGYDIDSCLSSGTFKAEVKKDLADAQAAGGRGTPYFVINGKPLSGAQPFEAFKQVIDAELA